MKKLLIALIIGSLLVPVVAWGQTWIDPHMDSDGNYVAGHWQTSEDVRQQRYTTPGRVNPYTGKFDPYSSSLPSPRPMNPQPITPYQPNYQPNYQPDFQPNYKIPGSAVGGGE
jgi:hypothetical protein